MAVTYVGQGAGQLVFTNTIVLAKPSGLAVGEFMVAFLFCSSASTPTFSIPSGWGTIIQTTFNAANGGTSLAFFKIADAADVAASTFTFTGTSGSVGAIFGFIGQYTGVSGAFPINGTPTALVTNSGSTGIFPSITTTVANALVVQVGLYTYAATPSGTEFSNAVPSGTTIEGNANQPAFSAIYAAIGFTQPTAGATGNKTVPINGARSAGSPFDAITFALRPKVDYPVSWSPGSVGSSLAGAVTAQGKESSTLSLAAGITPATSASTFCTAALSSITALSGSGSTSISGSIALAAAASVNGLASASAFSTSALIGSAAISGISSRGATGSVILGVSGGITGAAILAATASLNLNTTTGIASILKASEGASSVIGASAGVDARTGGEAAAWSVLAVAGIVGTARAAGASSASLMNVAALAGVTSAAKSGSAALLASAAMAGQGSVGKATSGNLGARADMSFTAFIGKSASALLGTVADAIATSRAGQAISALFDAIANFLGIGGGGDDPMPIDPCRTLYVQAENRTLYVQDETRILIVGAEKRTLYVEDCEC